MEESENNTQNVEVLEKNKETKNSILVLTPTKIDITEPAYKSVVNLKNALGDTEITNIALTGPYGSGKSSVLKTLKELTTDYTFLNISLATLEANDVLATEKKNTDPDPNCPLEKCKANENKKADKDISQLVEYSILQQIIYKEKPDSIPQSRFKRIKHIPENKSHKFAWQFIGLIISVFILIKPDWFVNNHLYKMATLDKLVESLYEVFSLGYIVFIIYSIIKYLTVTLYNNSLNKINFKNGEIEISETTSIFNKHLDEIIYFFEVTKYNVIVFEDLDRFKDHNIFLKLRELNTLLNESNSVDKRVVFIYAVRDDIFKDTSRTKFFDYIETIIPVINPSNACDQLQIHLKPFVKENEISNKTYRELGQFIDDMRTLKNIVNEFLQYRSRLDDKLVPKKMLGMIVYKNYYPEDFSALHNNMGILNQLIKDKNKYIIDSVSKINEKIKILKDNLIEVEKKNKINELELRTIYAHKYIENIDKFVAFISVDGNEYSIKDMINSADLFELLTKNQIISYKFFNINSGRNAINNLNVKFEEIEKLIDNKNSYQKRLDQINEGYNIKILNEIEEKESEIENLNSLPLKIIITENECTEYHKVADEAKNRLIDFLLQQGYIEEDYYKYISYFYTGSLTPSDKDFLLDLMRRKKYEYNYPLQNIEGLINEIAPQYYKTEAILNVALINYIAENSSNHKQKIKWITDVIIKRKNIEFTRLIYSTKASVYLFDFYNSLFSKWEDFWLDVQYKVSNDDEIKLLAEIYLLFRPRVLSRKDDEQFKNYLENNYAIVYHTCEKYNSLDVINIAKILGCKFKTIYSVGLLDIAFPKVVEFNLYEINDENIKEIIKFEGKEDAIINYQTASYTTILANCKNSTIEYINTELEKCLNSIFPSTSVYESEKTLITLLSLDLNQFNQEARNNYLRKQVNKINNINSIIKDFWNSALLFNIINPSWENISSYFVSVDYTINSELNDFIEENINILQDTFVPTEIDPELINKMFVEFICTNKLSFKTYKLLTPLFLRRFHKFDFNGLDVERILFLIQNMKIDYNAENYNVLEVNYSSNVLFEFIKVHKKDFLKEITKYSLDENMIVKIIDSNSFKNEEKQKILDNNLVDTLITKKETGNILLKYCLGNSKADISQQSMVKILSLSTENRIKFATKILDKYSWSEINIIEVLETLGGKYKELTKKGARRSFENTIENDEFLYKLLEIEFLSTINTKENKIMVSRRYL